MYRIIKIALVLGMTGILAACAASEPKHANLEKFSVNPYKPIDPSDEVLTRAIHNFITASGAPASSIYSFQRIDLDDDTRRDALVMFQNPYGYWCGLYGCTMLVMKAEDHDFKVVNAVQTVREPVYVSEAKTNGWKDILIHISGRWSKTKDVALQYDGTTYPDNPSDLPPYLMLASSATPLFKN